MIFFPHHSTVLQMMSQRYFGRAVDAGCRRDILRADCDNQAELQLFLPAQALLTQGRSHSGETIFEIEKRKGDLGETRTLDPLIKSQLLYQLSYEVGEKQN